MKSVWKISYNLRNKGEALSAMRFSTPDQSVRMVAQTAEEAVARLRKKHEGRKYSWDDDGTNRTETIEQLLLAGIEHQGHLDG